MYNFKRKLINILFFKFFDIKRAVLDRYDRIKNNLITRFSFKETKKKREKLFKYRVASRGTDVQLRFIIAPPLDQFSSRQDLT